MEFRSFLTFYFSQTFYLLNFTTYSASDQKLMTWRVKGVKLELDMDWA
jgi:hypothetical protein